MIQAVPQPIASDYSVLGFGTDTTTTFTGFLRRCIQGLSTVQSSIVAQKNSAAIDPKVLSEMQRVLHGMQKMHSDYTSRGEMNPTKVVNGFSRLVGIFMQGVKQGHPFLLQNVIQIFQHFLSSIDVHVQSLIHNIGAALRIDYSKDPVSYSVQPRLEVDSNGQLYCNNIPVDLRSKYASLLQQYEIPRVVLLALDKGNAIPLQRWVKSQNNVFMTNLFLRANIHKASESFGDARRNAPTIVGPASAAVIPAISTNPNNAANVNTPVDQVSPKDRILDELVTY